MSRHGANYRGIASPNAYPAWSVDQENAAAVQQAMLDLAHRDHIHINLGETGDNGNGVDGSWRAKSQAAWNSFTPDQHREILAQAGLEQGALDPAVQAPVAAPKTLGDLRASAAANTPLSTPSPGEVALLAAATRHEQSLPMPSQVELQAMARAGQPSVAPQSAMNLPPNVSYVSRDASGRIVASQNPDKVGAIASQAKVVMLYGALNEIQNKFGRAATDQFVAAHQNDIRTFMSYSNPRDYNASANRVGEAAAAELGYHSKAEFLASINANLKNITVGGDHVSSTYLTNYTGEGQTTPRESSAIMSQAAQQFPGVFQQKYGNNYSSEWDNRGLTFMKPGELDDHEFRGAHASEPMANSLGVTANGGTVAIATTGGTDASRRADITRGTSVAVAAADPSAVQYAATSDPIVDRANQAILKYARAHEGQRYDLNNADKGVNCSTFSARALIAGSRASGTPISGVNATSEQQICAANGVSERTKLPYFSKNDLLNPATLNQLQPGMTVGLAFNSLNESYAQGRTNDISHIGIVVRDEKGRLSIADSSSPKGVGVTPIEDWITKNNGYDPKGARFYVAQPFEAGKSPNAQTAFNLPPAAPNAPVVAAVHTQKGTLHKMAAAAPYLSQAPG